MLSYRLQAASSCNVTAYVGHKTLSIRHPESFVKFAAWKSRSASQQSLDFTINLTAAAEDRGLARCLFPSTESVCLTNSSNCSPVHRKHMTHMRERNKAAVEVALRERQIHSPPGGLWEDGFSASGGFGVWSQSPRLNAYRRASTLGFDFYPMRTLPSLECSPLTFSYDLRDPHFETRIRGRRNLFLESWRQWDGGSCIKARDYSLNSLRASQSECSSIVV